MSDQEIDMQMQPEDLQALRDQADTVGLRDVELGKFLKLLIPHVAHAHGLDPALEDARLRDEQNRLQEETRRREAEARGESDNPLTPAQEESKRQSEAQGEDYAPGASGVDDTLDPTAQANQDAGAIVVPSAQANEILPDEPPPNTLSGNVSTYTDFSSSTSVAADDAASESSDEGKEE